MAKLILTRKSSPINRRQKYKVIIDGVEAGLIKNDDTEEYLLPAGIHTLQCKLNWMSSPIETVELKDSANTYLSVSNGMKYIVPLYVMLFVGILIPFFFRLSKLPIPDYVNILKIILVLPVVIYLVLYMSVFRKKYLLIGEDKSNPFK